MVSGYLKSQGVDIGSRIKKGRRWPRSTPPGRRRPLKRPRHFWSRPRLRPSGGGPGEVNGGGRAAAAAAVEQAKSDIDRLVAAKDYAQKTFDRVQALLKDRAIDALNLDEHQCQLATAMAAERTAHLAVLTARRNWPPSPPRSSRRRGCRRGQGGHGGRSGAPGHGPRQRGLYSDRRPVRRGVTMRAFNPGAFVRSASEGGESLS